MLGIVGLPIPDETLMAVVGYLIHKGQLAFAPAFAAAFLGSVCGITVSYVLGRKLGLPLVHRYGRYVHFGQAELDRVHNWFHRIGRWTLTFGYYILGVRHFTAYVAGTANMPYLEFACFAYSGGFLWCLSFISLGYYFADQLDWALAQMHHSAVIATVVVGCLILSYLVYRKLVKPSK